MDSPSTGRSAPLRRTVNRKVPSSNPVRGAKRIVLRNSFASRLTPAGRHVREVANTRGKSPSREGEHRWADSPRRGRLRQIGLRPPTFLWRRFSRLLLVNGAPNGTTEPRGLLGESATGHRELSLSLMPSKTTQAYAESHNRRLPC